MSVVDLTQGETGTVHTRVAAGAIYALAVLSLVNFANLMDRAIISVLVEPIKKDLALADWQVGTLTGLAFSVVYATLGLPIAWLADRKNRTRILGLAICVWSVMTALCGVAQNFVQLLFARFGVGAGEAACVPASHSLIGDYFPRRLRAVAVSVFQAVGSLGIMFGLMMAGLLGDQFGWRVTFVVLGLPGILIGLLTLLSVRDPVRGQFQLQVAAAANAPSSQNYRELLKQRTYRNILIAFALGAFGQYGIPLWLPAFFMRTHGMTLTEIGVWYSLSLGLGSVLGTIIGGLMAKPLIERDRRWEVWYPGITYLSSMPIFLAVFFAPSKTLAMALTFGASFVVSMGLGPGLASIQSVSQADCRARAVALAMFCAALLGQGGGPFVVGLTSDLLTPMYKDDALRISLAICSLAFVWAFFHFVRAGRTFSNDANQ